MLSVWTNSVIMALMFYAAIVSGESFLRGTNSSDPVVSTEAMNMMFCNGLRRCSRSMIAGDGKAFSFVCTPYETCVVTVGESTEIFTAVPNPPQGTYIPRSICHTDTCFKALVNADCYLFEGANEYSGCEAFYFYYYESCDDRSQCFQTRVPTVAPTDKIHKPKDCDTRAKKIGKVAASHARPMNEYRVGDPPRGDCLKKVRDAINEAMDLHLPKGYNGGSAGVYGPALLAGGFRKLNSEDYCDGDVIIWSITDKRKDGHIQTYYQGNWYSGCLQSNINPYKSDKNVQPPIPLSLPTLYRFSP